MSMHRPSRLLNRAEARAHSSFRLVSARLNTVEVQAIPASLGGYDEEFVNEVEDDLQCAICQLVLKNPVLTKCGHRFCRRCLDEHFRRQSTCPVDRTVLIRNRDLFPDKATARKIRSLFVHCSSEGCQWTGELRSKEAHLETCPLKVVSCTNAYCNETMTRNNLQSHATTTCRWRILQCIHCSVSHPACKTEDHGLECKRKPLNCPRNCGAVLPREELATHDGKDCPLTSTFCPYTEMGCTTQVQRREIETHLQAAVQPHLGLACAELNNTKEELKIFQDTTRNLAVRVTELENQLELFQTTLLLALRIDNDVVEKVNRLENKVDTFQTQFGNLEDKVDDLKDRVETVEMILKDVELKQKHMEELPPYIWTVTDFWEKVSRAKNGREVRIDSNPFYVGLPGYKVKLYMYPNGIRGAINVCISLYFNLMKGQYDAILPWPFRYMVKLTVIDQNPDLKQKQNFSYSFSPEPSWETMQRPKREENKGHGINIFLSHEELRERSYVVDETLFIKFEASRCESV